MPIIFVDNERSILMTAGAITRVKLCRPTNTWIWGRIEILESDLVVPLACLDTKGRILQLLRTYEFLPQVVGREGRDGWPGSHFTITVDMCEAFNNVRDDRRFVAYHKESRKPLIILTTEDPISP